MESLQNIGTLLKEYRARHSLSMPSLADLVGIPKDRLYKWEKGSVPYQTSEVTKLLELIQNDIVPTVNESSSPPYHVGRLARKNNKEWKGIPVFEASPVTATNTEVYHDVRLDHPDFYLNVPALRDCNYAARARGDSMHPKISNGDIVIGKELMDASVILFGEIYIIHTRNGIETVKYIHPCDGDAECLELVPYNDAAKKTKIKKTDIARLFEYRAVFKL